MQLAACGKHVAFLAFHPIIIRWQLQSCRLFIFGTRGAEFRPHHLPINIDIEQILGTVVYPLRMMQLQLEKTACRFMKSSPRSWPKTKRGQKTKRGPSAPTINRNKAASPFCPPTGSDKISKAFLYLRFAMVANVRSFLQAVRELVLLRVPLKHETLLVLRYLLWARCHIVADIPKDRCRQSNCQFLYASSSHCEPDHPTMVSVAQTRTLVTQLVPLIILCTGSSGESYQSPLDPFLSTSIPPLG